MTRTYVHIKDVDKLNLVMASQGFSFTDLSYKLEKCRQYTSSIMKSGRLSRKVAKQICKVLKVKFEDHFDLIKKEI